jgi:hypothetical protein
MENGQMGSYGSGGTSTPSNATPSHGLRHSAHPTRQGPGPTETLLPCVEADLTDITDTTFRHLPSGYVNYQR